VKLKLLAHTASGTKKAGFVKLDLAKFVNDKMNGNK